MPRRVIVPDPAAIAVSEDPLQDIYLAARNGLRSYNMHERGAAEKLAYIVARVERHTLDSANNTTA